MSSSPLSITLYKHKTFVENSELQTIPISFDHMEENKSKSINIGFYTPSNHLLSYACSQFLSILVNI
jgi:hypothetical protein